MQDADILRNFYLKASSTKGWASGNDGDDSPLAVPGLKGIAIILDEYPGLLYVDRWGKDPKTGLPSGNIVISEEVTRRMTIPRWVMWYGGALYEKAALPFLRSSLLQSYQAGQFTGGRGPHEVDGEEFQYFNDWKGDFTHFGGFERVWGQAANRELGGHEYWGGLIQR